MALDVVCVGSATIDMCMEAPCKVLRPGDKLLAKSMTRSFGGGGTNVAYALARLGIKAGYLGKVGKDSNGDEIIAMLKKSSVTVVPVARGSVTDTSIVISEEGRDRIIVNYKAASMEFSKKDVSVVKSSWVYMSSCGKSVNTALSIVKGKKVMCNPNTDFISLGLQKLKPLFLVTDVLVLNLREARTLLGSHGSPWQCLDVLNRLVRGFAIITDGKHGVYCEGRHERPPKVKVVNTTGAGDAFNAGFLASYMKKGNVDAALALGLRNSSSVIQKDGAKIGLLSR